MTTQVDGPRVVRGENPEPESGWSWYLTDYEIAYIREFNVRPPRGGAWQATPEAEYRLETEAEGIRQKTFVTAKTPWRKQRVRRSWPWVTIAVTLTTGSLALGALGCLEYQKVESIDHQTSLIKQKLSDE
ncbi:hypothetical protein [Gryllotalpicola ginsengisoli]|uniref:hypothetical protein n=1 Tax=Gryllotalpicola ginsengisoli TaxID=444608 RepID=UPI0003B57B94|nr:hypothetical protein [Gryllotalpicola ginsengisoli]